MNYHPINIGPRTLRDFVTIAERVLGEDIRQGRKGAAEVTRGWAPKSDLREDDKCYSLSIDLPGVAKGAIDISYHDGVLTITGERRAHPRKEGSHSLIAERPDGKFARVVKIDDEINMGAITACCDNGVLTVTLPKAEGAKAVKVKVD